jgi:hypothetical protein
MRVKISFETRQDEVMQGTKTTSEFERDVESEEEAFAFGYTVAHIHANVFAGIAAANAEPEKGNGDDGGEG